MRIGWSASLQTLWRFTTVWAIARKSCQQCLKRVFFRQRLSNKFQKARHAELRGIVDAALCTDPFAVTPGVREFLGLRALTSEQVVSKAEFQRLLMLSYVSFSPIHENENDDADSVCSEEECSTASSSGAGSFADGSQPVRTQHRIFEEESEEDDSDDKVVASTSHSFFAADSFFRRHV